MERRDFIKFLSAAGLTAGASGWLAEQLWALDRERGLPVESAPLESWINTTCTLCPGGCGLRVRRYRGLPVHLVGNAHSPVSQGGLCPLGSAGLQVLYHPDRVRQPLKHIGKRGQDSWQPISWNEALRILLERLQHLRSSGQTQRLAFLDEGTSGTMEAIIAHFMQAYGSPNHLRRGRDLNARMAIQLTRGADLVPAYDLERARFVLNFGFDLLEAEGAPVRQMRAYGKMRARQRRQRGFLVHIEPHMSSTAAQADQWISPRPGSEAALALGIAHVLVRDHLYDRRFVEKYTFGFDDWTDSEGNKHIGFARFVLDDYAPEKVANLSGVPVEQVHHLAHAFGTYEAALALAGRGTSEHTNGLYLQLAVQALNALIGQVERPAGLLAMRPAPLRPLPDFTPDATARAGLRTPLPNTGAIPLLAPPSGDLFLNQLSQIDGQIDTLLLYHTNPAFDAADTQRIRHVLEHIPFVVSFASVLDESSLYADLVLPDHTYLERWDDAVEIPGLAQAHAAVQQPAVAPLYQTRHSGDVLMQIAQHLGEATASAFPKPDFPSLLRWRFRGLFESGRGHVAAEGGKPLPQASTFSEFWQQLLQHGTWVEPLDYPKIPTFSTPSGRWEFYAQTLRDHSSLTTATDANFLPHLKPPQFFGDPVKYPYYLCLFDTNTLFGGRGALLPLMMEMAGFRHDIFWDSWAEINPSTARQLALADGDLVFIESALGRLRTRVKIWPGTPPNMVAMPTGLGHEALGRYARGHGANPHHLLAQAQDPLSGASARLATRVSIARAG